MIKSADNEQVIGLRRGEVRAFDALYWKHHRAVFANIFRVVKDQEAAQDILQEVFIALWENRMTIDVDQSVAGWLFVVSYNKSLAYLNKVLRQSILKTEMTVEIYPDENEATIKDRQLRLLEEAIEHLSPQKRKVFELCKLQGRTYEDAAGEMNISKHTVKEYLTLAVNAIKDYVRNHPEYIILLLPFFTAP